MILFNVPRFLWPSRGGALDKIAASLAAFEKPLIDQLLVGQYDGVAGHPQKGGEIAALRHPRIARNTALLNRSHDHLPDLNLKRTPLVRKLAEQRLPNDRLIAAEASRRGALLRRSDAVQLALIFGRSGHEARRA